MSTPDLAEQAAAAIDMIGRTGGATFQFRWSDDEEPLIWLAVATYPNGSAEAAAAIRPERAIYRLLEALLDGGKCVHCGKITAVDNDWTAGQPLDGTLMCWYVYDPELKRYRRGCE